MKALQANMLTVNARPHLSSLWLFPGLYISTVLLNQPDSIVVWIGQIIGWINILAALHILITNRWNKILIISLFVGLVSARMLRIVFTLELFESLYTIFLNAIYCFAGVVVVFKSQNLLYKQVMVIALINFVFMILQVAGVGAWTQAFSTYGEGNFAEQVQTLFVPAQDIIYKVVQLRPAGISYSTVILTILILFGLLLHFSRKSNRLGWGNIILVGMVVFSMGKMAIGGFIIISAWILLSGNNWQRKGVINGMLLCFIISILYKLLFPGLWEINTSYYTLSTSFYLRLNDIIMYLNPNSFLYREGVYFLKDTSVATWATEGRHVSGYSRLLSSSQWSASYLLIGIIAFLVGLRKLHKRHPDLTANAFIGLSLFATLPFMFPFWASSLYWFMASFGLQPIIMIITPRVFNKY